MQLLLEMTDEQRDLVVKSMNNSKLVHALSDLSAGWDGNAHPIDGQTNLVKVVNQLQDEVISRLNDPTGEDSYITPNNNEDFDAFTIDKFSDELKKLRLMSENLDDKFIERGISLVYAKYAPNAHIILDDKGGSSLHPLTEAFYADIKNIVSLFWDFDNWSIE